MLAGALVGGPDNALDEWEDDRENYVTNEVIIILSGDPKYPCLMVTLEVALDYNAAFSGLLAGVMEEESRQQGEPE